MSTTFAMFRSLLLKLRRLAQRGVSRIVFYDTYLKLCEEHREKPYQLVLKLGAKSNSVVYQWSKGSKPRSDMLLKLSDYFNVPVAYLLTGDETLLEKEKPATEVTGESDAVIRSIMDRVSKLSAQDLIRLNGYLDSFDYEEGDDK